MTQLFCWKFWGGGYSLLLNSPPCIAEWVNLVTGELSRLSSLLCANVASCLTHHSHRPSPPDSFIPGFKTIFSTNRSRRSLPFLFPDGFPGLFTDTSAHICFYFLVFLFSTFWLLVPCGRLSWLVSFWAHVKIASRIVGAYRMFTDNGTAELAVQQAGSRRRSCVRIHVYSPLCHLNLQSRNPLSIPFAHRYLSV